MLMLRAARCVAIAVLLMPIASVGQTPTQQLDALLANVHTLTADVTQLIIESDGGVLEESEIRMKLKKPDGFYWETLTPFPELIVTDGTLLWDYQPDLEQVVIESWDATRSELAAQLLNGQTDNLAQEYDIAVAESGDTDHNEFTLTPRASDSVYTEISIGFIHEDLDMIYLHSKNGQKTVWQFTNIKRNARLSDSTFEFVAPEGVEIIQNNYTN